MEILGGSSLAVSYIIVTTVLRKMNDPIDILIQIAMTEMLLMDGQLGGGVRLRSRLSPGGGRNQKCHFKAKADTFLLNSFLYRAYYVNSYKKLDQKAQNLDITSFTIGLGPK